MYSPDERDRLREVLVAAARRDERITGAALTGSASVGAADRWSDIDLVFGIGGDPGLVIADWTELMYAEHGALHHMELANRGAVYRVFLLPSTLQVDLGFAPAGQFGAVGSTFRLLFGTAAELPQPGPPEPVALIGMGWLYALHARSSLARGRVWQAEYMINGMRGQVLALACVRHCLPAHEGRGLDRLPAEATASVAAALVRSMDPAELARAFWAVTGALLGEIRLHDETLADRLDGCLHELAATDRRAGHQGRAHEIDER